MGIAITLKEYLAEHNSSYEEILHTRTSSTLQTSEAAHVPGDRMVKPVLLGDEDRYLLALIPATHRLEIDRLSEALGRKLELIPENEVASAFSDCELGAIPPVGDAYGIETWVDSSLVDLPEVYFESGDHEVLIRMDGEQFRKLLGEATPAQISHHI